MPDAPVYSAADFQTAALALLPSGPVWPKDTDSVQAKVAAGLASIYARLTVRSGALLQDSPTGTLVERLPEWESTLGLPDPCLGPVSTIALRQRSVRAAIQAQGGQSIAYYTQVAASLGYSITVAEYKPTRYGVRYGARYFGLPWAHAWLVTVSAGSIVSATYGSARYGDPYRSWGSRVLECTLDRIKPAHTALRFAYTDPGAFSTAPLGVFVLGRNIAP